MTHGRDKKVTDIVELRDSSRPFTGYEFYINPFNTPPAPPPSPAATASTEPPLITFLIDDYKLQSQEITTGVTDMSISRQPQSTASDEFVTDHLRAGLHELLSQYKNNIKSIDDYITIYNRLCPRPDLQIAEDFSPAQTIISIAKLSEWDAKGTSVWGYSITPAGVAKIRTSQPDLDDLASNAEAELRKNKLTRQAITTEFYQLISALHKNLVPNAIRFVAIEAFCMKFNSELKEGLTIMANIRRASSSSPRQGVSS